jgi:hypothetical protein
MTAHRLHELERISRKIALISGYTWFSTEIALTMRDGRRAFLPIDYLNNKCFMLTHSEFGPSGLPDAVAAAVAHEIVEQTHRHAHRFDHSNCGGWVLKRGQTLPLNPPLLQ